MPAKTGSRNGISYGWALGENNWNTGMDGNLTFIDRFGVHLSFKSFLNTPPGSPAAGDCHVIDAVPTGVWVGKAGQVAVYDDGAWRYGVPRTGWRAYCEADERQYVYDGGWAPTASEWSADTVTQAEAEAGTATTRRAWTAQRVKQAIAAWWNSAKGALIGPVGINGDLEFTGTASRIRGDFSNATLTDRGMFQTNTVNGATDVGVTPNGTSTTAGITAYNAADPTNASTTTLQTTSTQSKLIAGKTGAGSYKPLALNVSGADRLAIETTLGAVGIGSAGADGNSRLSLTENSSVPDAISLSCSPDNTFANWRHRLDCTTYSGRLQLRDAGGVISATIHSAGPSFVRDGFTVNGPSGLGYGAGAGGVVEQTTSISTAVTLNKPCGRIDLFNAAVGIGGIRQFPLINNLLTDGDGVKIDFGDIGHGDTGDGWVANTRMAGTTCVITLWNRIGVATASDFAVYFKIMKGSDS